MRRLQLFVPSKTAELECLSQTEVIPVTTELSVMAEDYISIGKKIIEPMLKDPTAAIVMTEDLKMALFALKNAAEIYEKLKVWDDAIFAWSMIKAVPVAPEFQWNAPERIEQCKKQILLTPHPPSRPAGVSRGTVSFAPEPI